jgi:hypothetical protein
MAGRFTANGTSRLPTRCDLSEVVQPIARYEPVRLLARRGSGYREARREFATCPNVTVIDAPVDDFWMRDIMPTFALRGQGAAQEVVAIDWNFNGWGDTPDRPRRAGDRVAKAAATIFGVPRVAVPFVAEGGALVTDGCGTMITTRSCLLNPNRNPVRRGLDRHRHPSATNSLEGLVRYPLAHVPRDEFRPPIVDRGRRLGFRPAGDLSSRHCAGVGLRAVLQYVHYHRQSIATQRCCAG